MTQRLFRAGDKVRVLASPHDDWAGTATVTANQASNNPLVSFAKDNPTPCTYRTGFCHWRKLELIAAGAQEATT